MFVCSLFFSCFSTQELFSVKTSNGHRRSVGSEFNGDDCRLRKKEMNTSKYPDHWAYMEDDIENGHPVNKRVGYFCEKPFIKRFVRISTMTLSSLRRKSSRT